MKPITIDCENHNPVQHRDGRAPWCKCCGLTAEFTIPRRHPAMEQAPPTVEPAPADVIELDANWLDQNPQFEEVADADANALLNQAFVASGVMVMAAAVPVGDIKMPCLVLHFARPDGGMYPPMALITDAHQMTKLKTMTTDAVDAAVGAAQ